MNAKEGGALLGAAEIERFGHNPAATIKANLADIRARIDRACEKAGRNPSEVRLLPISKTVPAHILRLACGVGSGFDMLGENKVQEAKDKSETLKDLPLRWSVVGHLQTNKAKYLVDFASEFHALDSLRLAETLNRRLDAAGRDLDVFVQVNSSNEESKFGLAPADVSDFVERLKDYPRLRARGFMTLALFSAEEKRVRDCFRLMRRLRDEICANPLYAHLSQLSMGMSGDFEAAIEEGANIVRVGQAIFGVRPGSDAHYWPGLIPEK